MKEFIEAKLREGQFSTPSEYIRSLIRDDQDLNGSREAVILVRRGMLSRTSRHEVGEPSDRDSIRIHPPNGGSGQQENGPE